MKKKVSDFPSSMIQRQFFKLLKMIFSVTSHKMEAQYSILKNAGKTNTAIVLHWHNVSLSPAG